MKRFFLISILAMLLANNAWAQKSQRYEGDMRLPADLHEFSKFMEGFNQIGKATYDYYENEDEDRIKNGKFTLIFDGHTNVQREITGTFKDGKKEGSWIIHDIINGPTNYSKHYDINISMKDDVYNGPCKFVYQAVNNTYTINCTFENGVLVGDFSLEHTDSHQKGVTNTVNGKIGSNGTPEGIWIIKRKGGIEATQKRLYLYGGLVAAEEQDLSTGDKYLLYCAFPNQKKIPDATEITSSTEDDKEYISYQGLTAHKDGFTLTDHLFYVDSRDIENMFKKSVIPNWGSLWVTELIDLFPNSMWVDDDSAFGTQRDNWAYYYKQ